MFCQCGYFLGLRFIKSYYVLHNKTLPISVTMANRPSYGQLEGLVDFLEQNPGVAKGLLRTAQGKLKTKRKWENLATALNSLGGAIKNGQGWAKVIQYNEMLT